MDAHALDQALGPHVTLERELEGGGMARVFLATDTELGRRIVVKLLAGARDEGVDAARFQLETRVAAQLQHPHIVPVLSAGVVNDVPFYTMPFVNGLSLRHRLAQTGRLEVTEAVRILREVTRALAHAHAEGIIHRDIKPENILLSSGVAMLTDFGIARALDRARVGVATGRTETGLGLGTAAYVAPEQAMDASSVDPRADLYALGAVAFEMLTGRTPFTQASASGQIAARFQGPAPKVATLRGDVWPALATLVDTLLQQDRERRPADANAVLSALDAAEETAASERGRRRQRVGLGAMAAVAVAALSIGLATPRAVQNLEWSRAQLGERVPVVVAAFRSTPVDSAWADAFEGTVRTGLEGSTRLMVLGGSRAADALMRMRQDRRVTPDSALAHELAVREGVPVLLTGSVSALGDVRTLTLRAIRTDSGTTIFVESRSVVTAAELVRESEGMMRRLRRRLGESATSLRKQAPLASVTTGSLEALAAYAQAERASAYGRSGQGMPFLLAAVEADSTFASAWRKLAVLLATGARHPTLTAGIAATRAFELREGLPALERAQIEASYYLFTGQYGRALEAHQAVVVLSDSTVGGINLSNQYIHQRRWEEAELACRANLRRVPELAGCYENLSWALFAQSKWEQVDSLVTAWAERFPADHRPLQLRIARAYWSRSPADFRAFADSVARDAPNTPAVRSEVARLGRSMDLLSGRYRAFERWERAQASSAPGVRTASQRLTAELDVVWNDLNLWRDGPRASERLSGALRAHPPSSLPATGPPYLLLLLSGVLGELGDAATLRPIVERFRSATADSTANLDYRFWSLQLQADLAIAERRPAEAVALLRERGDQAYMPEQLPLLVARAFDLGGVPDSAITWYEDYLRIPYHDRWRPLRDPLLLGFTLERLSELHEERGALERSAHYAQRLLDLWVTPDPELRPRVQALQRRVARWRATQ